MRSGVGTLEAARVLVQTREREGVCRLGGEKWEKGLCKEKGGRRGLNLRAPVKLRAKGQGLSRKKYVAAVQKELGRYEKKDESRGTQKTSRTGKSYSELSGEVNTMRGRRSPEGGLRQVLKRQIRGGFASRAFGGVETIDEVVDLPWKALRESRRYVVFKNCVAREWKSSTNH